MVRWRQRVACDWLRRLRLENVLMQAMTSGGALEPGLAATLQRESANAFANARKHGRAASARGPTQLATVNLRNFLRRQLRYFSGDVAGEDSGWTGR